VDQWLSGARLDDDESDEQDSAGDVACDNLRAAEAGVDRRHRGVKDGNEADGESELAGHVQFAPLGGCGIFRADRDEKNDDGNSGRNQIGRAPATEGVRGAWSTAGHGEELRSEPGKHRGNHRAQ
jgi:hypothetical protein